MKAPISDSTFVWRGRVADLAAGHDGWDTDPRELTELLPGFQEIVVVDPLSFPWKHLRHAARAVPITVQLPSDLGPEEIQVVLGRPLLRHVTAYDRLVDDRDDVRRVLSDVNRLPPVVWEPPDDADRQRRAEGKARLYEAVETVRAAVRPVVKSQETPPLLGFLGRARQLAGPVAAALRCPHAYYSVDTDEPETPSPHALVVWLEDGAQSVGDRLALLGRARDLLHPGGRLVVLGYAVTAPDGADNPRVTTLVEELAEAFGAMVHVDEVQAVRWRGESLARGVLLAGSSLVVERI